MPNQVHRHQNPLLAGLACDGLTPMIIADGHHLPEHVVKLVLDCRGSAGVVVVSDASRLAGLAPGRYRDGDNDVVIEESGLLWNPAKECLVGSSATLNGCRAVLRRWGYDEAAVEGLTGGNAWRLIGRA